MKFVEGSRTKAMKNKPASRRPSLSTCSFTALVHRFTPPDDAGTDFAGLLFYRACSPLHPSNQAGKVRQTVEISAKYVAR